MSDASDSLIRKLELFGFNENESLVYLLLLKNSGYTALAISKKLKIPRTRVYRTLEKLIEKGFVTEEIDGYGSKFHASSYEKLNLLIDQRESQLNDLKQNAPELFNKLALLQASASEETKILHYRGLEGLKQVTWNSTKVAGDFRIYEVNLLHQVVDNKFAEEARIEFAKHPEHKFMQLTNLTEFEEYTNITGHIDQWEVRHIPKKELDIKFEIQIYNNVYCMFNYADNDIFIVEIYSSQLAQMQKQLFDLIWKSARKMKKIGRKGAAQLD